MKSNYHGRHIRPPAITLWWLRVREREARWRVREDYRLALESEYRERHP
jgi:hypothetical protein